MMRKIEDAEGSPLFPSLALKRDYPLPILWMYQRKRGRLVSSVACSEVCAPQTLEALLVDERQGLEVIDFKTQPCPTEDAAYLASYRQQIQLYAYALPHHPGQSPRRLWLYWTAEEQRANALMEVSCDQDEIEQVVADVDDLAEKIQQKHFDVKVRPASTVCQRCDIRHLCRKDGTLR